MEAHPERLIELGAVLVGLSLLARIAGALRVPAIPLYLLAGLAFGRGGIVPLVTTTEFIGLGAEIGLILLLLTLGLEYSARELVSTMRHHAPDGLLDLALNFTPGFVAGLLLGWGAIGAGVLGGITYVSSSGIAAKLLHDFKWTARPGARVVVSLLIFEDLAMALYLPGSAIPTKRCSSRSSDSRSSAPVSQRWCRSRPPWVR
jgi:monovalent cation:H+ antiporter-2, CPA2 family